ncbi:glycosyltransferase [Burkholderia diffusa]|uniref:glycosyltransferase n=1 Tax=Burkholderia diffusa TaxID=488732 RepID=UPI00158952E9|nr:glycosyltransferase [Burkholderia diffusa]
MSIKSGNDLFKSEKYEQAISEYLKVGKDSRLFGLAQFNIELARSRQKQLERADSNVVIGIDLKPEQRGPMLSIIMPVFNVAQYLEASILSVLGQSFTDFELIIVDDASTDNSAKVIDFLAKQDSRIKFVKLNHNSLGGAGIPSNVGIRMATGKYIGFVDSDDLVHKNAFRDMVAAAEKNSVEVVVGDFARFDQEYDVPAKAYDKNYWIDIPRDKVFNPLDAPRIFRLSPVPWRKLYRRDFMEKHNIGYAEGDFFYEDNPLHWAVLTRAKRVMMLDKVTSFHRMGREGQTMGANDYKFAAVFMHMNSTRHFLTKYPEAHRTHWVELLDQVYRSDWIYKDVQEPQVKNLLRKLNAITCTRTLADSGVKVAELNKTRPDFERRYKENNACRPDVDLTVIVPVYHAEPFLDELFDALSKIRKIKFDVMFIDDGSTDGSLEKCNNFAKRSNLHCVFHQRNKGGGRARNAVIPLANGKYTYFFDADDVLMPRVLEESVLTAEKNNNDLYFMPYKLLRSNGNGERISDMFPTDLRLWEVLKNERDSSKRAEIVAGMGNYPWNRIIKTTLLHDNNIFFGGSPVHNDVQYHWHSICAAESIGYGDQVVCHHRLFEEKSQTTNISDRRRLHVFSALEDTYSALVNNTSFSRIFNVWVQSSSKIIDWAEGVIQKSLHDEFNLRKQECLAKISVAPGGTAISNEMCVA